jgi:serine/threonine protein kinase/Tol biopolymer transport system component
MPQSPDRWVTLERLYFAALARPLETRPAFLAEACAGDDELRQEVASLLAQRGSAERFFERGAVVEAARLAGGSSAVMFAGQHIGVYEVLSLLGAGGMGEVYRARDTRLGRDVAIKVIPPAFAAIADRLARLEREARVLASLSHPHIAAIYGIEEASLNAGDGVSRPVRALVLELVEGETLAERIARSAKSSDAGSDGAGLPLKEALKIASQIADALDAAHQKGIVHRDLKPANIKITPAGVVKVLDFGLAKLAIDPAGGLSTSPTVTIGATGEGAIVGTAAYMSPEQACGKVVDKRSDIWSFGCVLFETLTGRQAFCGETFAHCVSAILNQDATWETLPATTPANVHNLLRRCLQKDPQDRLRDIGDARIELTDAVATPTRTTGVGAGAHRDRWRRALYAAAGMLAGAAIFGLVSWNAPSRTIEPANFTIRLGQDEFLPRSGGITFSSDGTSLAYVVARGEERRVHLRRIADTESRPIPGTDGLIGAPVFSPDGQWLAFWQNAKWKKVSLSGGPPLPMFDAPPGGATTAAWGSHDTLVFGVAPASLMLMPIAGGMPQDVPIIDPQRMERWGGEPQFLPDSKTVLFSMRTSDVDSFNDYRIAAYSLETMKRKILVDGGTKAMYLPNGQLVYVRAGSLWAAPFDPATLSITGRAVPVLHDVYENAVDGTAQFAISATGSLAYAPGGEVAGARRVVWVDRRGQEEALPLPPRSYLHPRMSPNGRQILIEVEGPNHDVFLYDMSRSALTKLTSDGSSHAPLWTPDGRQITFRAGMPDPFTMWRMPSDRSASPERLTAIRMPQIGFTQPSAMPGGGSMPGANTMSAAMPQQDGSTAASMPQTRGSVPPAMPQAGSMSNAVQQSAGGWSPDGRVLAFTQVNPDTDGDIYVFDGLRRSARSFAQTKFNEGSPRFSPDGRWISYSSDESGQSEIYVQEYPGPGPKIQVSTDGGTDAVWKPNGGELYYRTGDRMMVVSVETKPTFRPGRPRMLWEGRYNHGQNSMCGPPGPGSSNYDVTADGGRFLMVKEGERDAPPTEIRVVPKWAEEVARLVAPNPK